VRGGSRSAADADRPGRDLPLPGLPARPGGRRRSLIARTFAQDASYLDPMLRGDGRDGIDAMVKAVHEKYPGHKFTRTSDVDSHNDRARLTWELAPDGGRLLVKGIDFATLSGDGLLRSVTGFFTEMRPQ
jgi:hypothetical protein